MKTIKKIAMLIILLTAITCLVPQKASSQISVSFQLFYDDLSPHGYWINDSNYGYVWAPNVQEEFTPYNTNGYWVYTNFGWTWVSNYSWGWAPFHYGRWFYDSYYGWLWAPDTEWGPGWVTWRSSQGYYGWAPIGPGISINIAYSSGYNIPYNQWTFVRDRYFGRTNINNYYVNTSNNITIINNSTVINNIQTNNLTRSQYNAGPDRMDVQKITRSPVRQISLKERNQPGQRLNNNELHLYKPRIEKVNTERQRPTPSKVVSRDEMKPISQRDREPRKINSKREQQVFKQREIKNQRNVPQKDQQINQRGDVQKKQNNTDRDLNKQQGTQPQRKEHPNNQSEIIHERGNQKEIKQERGNPKEIHLERGNQPDQQQGVPIQKNEQQNVDQQQRDELDKQVKILNEEGKQQNKKTEVKQVEPEKPKNKKRKR
jgi:hypothetical protein